MAITRDKFRRLKKGDFILFKSGRCRKVVGTASYSLSITFEQLSNPGRHTTYLYADIYKKIKGIIRPKKKSVLSS